MSVCLFNYNYFIDKSLDINNLQHILDLHGTKTVEIHVCAKTGETFILKFVLLTRIINKYTYPLPGYFSVYKYNPVTYEWEKQDFTYKYEYKMKLDTRTGKEKLIIDTYSYGFRRWFKNTIDKTGKFTGPVFLFYFNDRNLGGIRPRDVRVRKEDLLIEAIIIESGNNEQLHELPDINIDLLTVSEESDTNEHHENDSYIDLSA